MRMIYSHIVYYLLDHYSHAIHFIDPRIDNQLVDLLKREAATFKVRRITVWAIWVMRFRYVRTTNCASVLTIYLVWDVLTHH
jgi:hypothetical protein